MVKFDLFLSIFDVLFVSDDVVHLQLLHQRNKFRCFFFIFNVTFDRLGYFVSIKIINDNYPSLLPFHCEFFFIFILVQMFVKKSLRFARNTNEKIYFKKKKQINTEELNTEPNKHFGEGWKIVWLAVLDEVVSLRPFSLAIRPMKKNPTATIIFCFFSQRTNFLFLTICS